MFLGNKSIYSQYKFVLHYETKIIILHQKLKRIIMILENRSEYFILAPMKVHFISKQDLVITRIF